MTMAVYIAELSTTMLFRTKTTKQFGWTSISNMIFEPKRHLKHLDRFRDTHRRTYRDREIEREREREREREKERDN